MKKLEISKISLLGPKERRMGWNQKKEQWRKTKEKRRQKKEKRWENEGENLQQNQEIKCKERFPEKQEKNNFKRREITMCAERTELQNCWIAEDWKKRTVSDRKKSYELEA